MSVRFSNQMVPEVVQPFWAALQRGEFLTDAAAVAGTHRWRGLRAHPVLDRGGTVGIEDVALVQHRIGDGVHRVHILAHRETASSPASGAAGSPR